MRRTGLSFKEALNQCIRRAQLAAKPTPSDVLPPMFPAVFSAEFSGVSVNRLADELDDAATLRELGAESFMIKTKKSVINGLNWT